MARLERKTNWWTTGDAATPWKTSVDGKMLLVRVYEPPAKRYTLLVDGRPVEELDDWPSTWLQHQPQNEDDPHERATYEAEERKLAAATEPSKLIKE